MIALHRHTGARAVLLSSLLLFAASEVHAQNVAGSGGGGRIVISVNGTARTVTNLNLSTGLTAVLDGGILTLTASGGGGSANNPTGCVQGAIISASSDAGASTCNSNLVTVDNAGNITTPVGGTINGRDLRSDGVKIDNLPARVISSDEFKSGTQDFDYCFSSDVTTTNATATVFYRIAMPQASQLHVTYTCNATQFDGGAIVSARYERRLTSTLADGGSAPATVGGIDTIGTDRENDTTWGGPSVVTYDGGSNTGIVELVLQGVAGQAINWNCSGCWKRTPRADSGIP